jgi:hypothetical protein
LKTALITTTINVPHVLHLYRKYGPPTNQMQYFIAADLKTPESQCQMEQHQNLLTVEYQKSLRYKCSGLIGWNSIQRRNIALLEALDWGADIIVSIDDDNVPMGADYFYSFEHALELPFDGLSIEGAWFDVGRLLDPPAVHRGFPTQVGLPELKVNPITDAKIGVAAGICLGDPDTTAVNRIANRPTVHRVSELLNAGIVIDPKNTRTVFNSQNTAIIRELAPAWFVWPGVGRYDDIMASLVVQRVMRDRGYHIHFGRPYVWQQRNRHDLTHDFVAELWGMQNFLKIAEILDKCFLPSGTTVIEDTRALFRALRNFDPLFAIPNSTFMAAMACLDDCEQVF